MEADEDERMDEDSAPPSDEEEGEGVMSEDEHDSSEESEEDDPEEARRIAEGFIVDDDRERRKKHKKRHKKKKHRRHREDGEAGSDVGELDEDDLDLLEQNTGRRIERPEQPRKLFRRGDQRDAERPDAPTLEGLFGQETVRRLDDDDDDMADFIEDDEDDDAGPPAARERERAAKSSARAGRMGFSRAAAGLSQEVWEEIQEIFGNGSDFDWAMDAEDEALAKGEVKLEDIYEPSQIAERMMTAADEEIRAVDQPERLQIATAALLSAQAREIVDDTVPPIIHPDELDVATEWVAPKISNNLSATFLVNFEGGIEHPLRGAFMMAVRTALQQICSMHLEPPFVWLHRRDYFVHFDPSNPNPQLQYCDLLGRSHLWTIQTLGIKYRAFIDRRKALRETFDSLHEGHDQAFEDAFMAVESVEEVADLSEWVNMRYMRELQRLKDVSLDMEPPAVNGTQKKASRESRYSRIRNSLVYDLAQQFGSSPADVSRDFTEGMRRNFADDPPVSPEVYAESYTDPSFAYAATPDVVLESAKYAVVHEFASLAPLRKAVRRIFRDHGLVTVRPTDQGISNIDRFHPYYAFKYVTAKPVRELRQSSTFVYISDAEKNGNVTVSITLPEKDRDDFLRDLSRVYLSDYTSNDAEAWNALRKDILETVIDRHLLPSGASWLRDQLHEEVQEFVARRCGEELMKRVDVASFRTRSLGEGEIPGVVAISHGAGDPKKDSVWVVHLDDDGRVREHFTVDNLRPSNPRNPDGDDYRERLTDLLLRRRPQVIVLGGFTPTTHRMAQDVAAIVSTVVPRIAQDIRDDKDEDDQRLYPTSEAATVAASIEVIYVNDEVARIYQHSKRAQGEFAELPTTGKYCVALARYVQSPVNEYAALGKDLLALTFDNAQKFINEAILLAHLDRAIISSVNTCGVDINRAVRDPYYAFLLPYVAGLGPRKAQRMIQRINANGGTLPSRAALVTTNIVARVVFINCAAFLRIDHDDLPKRLLNTAGEDAPDILDSTRIHPEDYDIARKMAADAEELDEEDLADLTHPSQVVSRLLEDDAKKLDELSLDDFAVELQRLLGTPKRLTLYLIRDELKTPFKEQRPALSALEAPQIFSQLTGETRQTLELGLIIPVLVVRLIGDKRILVRLDSGIEGTVDMGYFDMPPPGMTLHQMYQIGQTIQAVIINISMTEFIVSLDCRRSSIEQGDLQFRTIQRDAYWDDNDEQLDASRAEKIKKKQSNRSYRTIQHPYFHNYDSRQAEDYLASQPRGECVVRPSGRGPDHLAVTWKVERDLYQHIDVLELDKPSEFELGRLLKISGKYSYSDIDELVVSHVKAMARKIEEMLMHDKFKGEEETCIKFLRNFQLANPDKSIYAFALDRKNAGQFLLMFLTSKSATPRSWPVRVEPGTFNLAGTAAPDVMSLCNAFKTQYVSQLSERSAPGARQGGGGRTPYGAAANAGAYGYGQLYQQNGAYAYGQPYGGLPQAAYGAAYR